MPGLVGRRGALSCDTGVLESDVRAAPMGAPTGLRGLPVTVEFVVADSGDVLCGVVAAASRTVGVAVLRRLVGVLLPECESPPLRLLPGRAAPGVARGGGVRVLFRVSVLARDFVSLTSLERDFLSLEDCVSRENTEPPVRPGDLEDFAVLGVGGSTALSLAYLDEVLLGVGGALALLDTLSSLSSLSGVFVIVRL